jgi:DNA-binding transcriptional ArsR family regulator
MSAILTLDLPWVEGRTGRLDDLAVGRGRVNTLTYDDGIVLDVQVIDPAAYNSLSALLDAVRAAAGPGRVVLVAGAVPLDWRARLREAEVSFVDVSGVAEIAWPRIHVRERHFGKPARRRRAPLPFQQGHALVAQELLAVTADGSHPTIGDLATSAHVSLSTTSRAISQLAEHGLVIRQRQGRSIAVEVVDRVTIATRLAERTAWPGDETLPGFRWGRTIFDVAARLSEAGTGVGIDVALTGRLGAAFYGVLGTSSPDQARCWVDVGQRSLADAAEALGLEPADEESANVLLSTDRWRVGTHRRREVHQEDVTAWVAHPLRVWCDLHAERRGVEYAAQLWGAVSGR